MTNEQQASSLHVGPHVGPHVITSKYCKLATVLGSKKIFESYFHKLPTVLKAILKP